MSKIWKKSRHMREIWKEESNKCYINIDGWEINKTVLNITNIYHACGGRMQLDKNKNKCTGCNMTIPDNIL